MEPSVTSQKFLEWFASVDRLIAHQLLTPVNMAQVPAVLGTWVVAWLIARLADPWLRSVFRNVAVDEYQESFYLKGLLPLAQPVLWIVGLSLSLFAADRYGWPSHLVNIAVNLAVAWLVIRFAVAMIPNAAVSRAVAVVAFLIAALNILGLLAPLIEALRAAKLSIIGSGVSLLTVLEALLTLAVFLWISTLVARFLERRIEALPNLTPPARVLFGKLVKIGLIALAFTVSLGMAGIDLTALAVFTGAVGVGIGFGLQKSVSNLFAGIVILLDKSIKPGDIIEAGGTFGWVAALGARYVAVETRDGTVFLIPNEDIITHQVFNWTHQNDNVRLKVRARVAYDTDVKKALDLMRQAASKFGRVLKTPAPNPLVIGLGENGVDLELRFWIADVRNGVHNISSQVLLEVLELFGEHGIKIPRPQRDVHMRTLPQGVGGTRLHAPDGTVLPVRCAQESRPDGAAQAEREDG